MPYATPLDLEQRFGAAELIQQTDLSGAGEYNADTVARALEDASALIDGYLASRYPLPIASPTRRSPPGRTGFRMRAGRHGPSGSSTRCSVHPHARGEHYRDAVGVPTWGGSSPRTWGTRIR